MFVALASSVFAFAFATGEAGAEQLPQTPQQPAVVTGDEAAGPATERKVTPVSPNGAIPVETDPAEMSPAERPPVEVPDMETVPLVGASPVEALPAEAPPGEGFAPRVPEPAIQPGLVPPELVGGQPGRYGSATLLDSVPPASGLATELSGGKLEAEPVSSGGDALLPTEQRDDSEAGQISGPAREPGASSGLAPPASEPEPELVAPGVVLESVAFDEGEPLPPDPVQSAEHGPVFPDAVAEEPYILEIAEGAAGDALEMFGGETLRPAPVDGDLFDAAFAGLFSETQTARAPGREAAEEPGAAPAREPTEPVESPLRDAPRPVSPFVPAGGSSFSLSGGSAFGLGGLALLLFCVLVPGLILSRRDSKLALTWRDLPKPNSALRLPLERPG